MNQRRKRSKSATMGRWGVMNDCRLGVINQWLRRGPEYLLEHLLEILFCLDLQVDGHLPHRSILVMQHTFAGGR
jgi:hypothetical protein